MSIEREIVDFLKSSLKDSNTKSRDIDLVIYYYGFQDNPWPRLEDAAEKFEVGGFESESRRVERPRQIIARKFKEKVSLDNLPELNNFLNFLKTSTFHTTSNLINYAATSNLFEGDINFISTLRLLDDLGWEKNFKAYSEDLKELTRTHLKSCRDILIIHDSVIEKYQKALKRAKTIPGLLGIAKLDYLKHDKVTNQIDYDNLVLLIKSNPDSWVNQDEGEQYYLFQSRDNTLINSIEKIRNIAAHVDINILSQALSNSLNRRTAPQKRSYPSDQLIHKYLLGSKYTEVRGTSVVLNVDKKDLTDIEQDIVKYMRENDVHDYPSISSYLISLGYGKPIVDKSIINSPLIFVDKKLGRSHYKYRLITDNDSSQAVELDLYEVFRQRLLSVTIEGTDGSIEGMTRKEHHILSEWLFKDKDHEYCAICKKLYSVKSLVTAHKKKRAECAENERTDPHIVMPLCVFGCDYLYENRFVYIESGQVKKDVNSSNGFYSEMPVIQSLDGNILDDRWLVGSELYFRKAT